MEKIKGMIRRLFATPKRSVITIVVAVCAMLVFSAGAVVASVVWDVNEDRVEYAITEKLTPDQAPPVMDENPGAPAEEAVPAVSDVPENGGMQALNEKKISQEKAESIALSDAGLKKKEVDHLHSHYEFDDGYHQYDIQFYKGEYEYEYAVDAGDGTILERDTDYIYD